MGKHPYRKWKCRICNKTMKQKDKPKKCDHCGMYGSFVFYGAKLLTKEEAKKW